MTIKVDKLLDRPSELHRRYSGRLAMQKSLQDKMVGGASGGVVLSKKSITNIETMRTKVTQIEGILKGTLAAEKKELDNKKRLESGKRREKQEEKLETKPNAEKGQMKMPSAPRLGILDWIKNFIGKIILGYFAVRLIEHLPKIMPIVKFLGSAADFIINIGGELLDKLITFVDWGYKAYDASRGFVKNLFGNDGVKQFDQLSSVLNKFLNLAIIAGMIIGGSGGFGGGGGGRGGKGNVGISGSGAGRSRYGASPAAARRYAERFGIDAAKKKFGQEAVESLGGKYARSGLTNLARKGAVAVLGKGGAKAVLKVVRPIVKNAPLIGGLLEFGISWALGDPLPKAAFRGVGTFLLGAIGTAIGGPIGLAIGGFAGGEIGGVLYDMFFGNKNPQPKGKVQGKAGGGITRGGKTQGGTKRTIGGTTKKGKYKRTLAQKPTQTRFKTTDKKVKEVSENLDKTQYFGPVLSVAAKVIENEKPDKKDYENAGLGLNLLIAKGIEDGQLKGGLVAAFAEGGMVDDEFLSAAEKGSNISNWIASTFNRLFESKVEQNLRLIKERQQKTTSLEGKDQFNEEGTILEGTTGGEYGPILDLIASVEAVGGYDVVNGGKISGLSKMTISAARQAAMKSGGSGAMGRYQQMPQFVLGRATSIGLNPDKDLFSPENQDKLCILLINGAGYKKWKAGEMTTEKFAHNLSATWRGLPEGPNNLTYQDRYASGNKAHTTWANVLATLNAAKSGRISGGDRGNFIGGGTGAGYGSGGAKIAGELGDYMKANRGKIGVTGSIHQHPRHPPLASRSYFSYHNQGRALDIGGYGPNHPSSGGRDEQAPVIRALLAWNKQNGYTPIEIIHGSPAFRGLGKYESAPNALHSHHVHVAYFKGGRVRKLTRAILAEKGPEFVFDADTTAGLDRLAPQLLERLNMAKTKPELANVLQMYTDYEQERPQIIEVPVEIPVPMPVGGEGGGGFAIALGGGEGGYDHASGLYER